MATEVEVKRWCDACMGEHDARVPGAPVTVSLAPRGALVLDLCDDHRKALLEPLEAALDAWGIKPESQDLARRARPAQRRTAAQAQNDLATLVASQANGSRRGQKPEGGRAHPCPWCPLDYAGATSLRAHVMSQHDAPGGLDVLTDTCPLCGQSGIAQLSGHVTRVHRDEAANGWQSLKVAEDKGDPFMVVAAVLAQGTNRA